MHEDDAVGDTIVAPLNIGEGHAVTAECALPLRVQLTDFGVCERLPLGSNGSFNREDRLLQGHRGKLVYMAPEEVGNFIAAERHAKMEMFDGLAADMWSCGVCLFLLLAGFPPVGIASQSDERFCVLLKRGVSALVHQWSVQMSAEALDLLSGLLEPDPTKRITAAQAAQHPFLLDSADNANAAAKHIGSKRTIATLLSNTWPPHELVPTQRKARRLKFTE